MRSRSHKKIIFVLGSLELGGAEKQAIQLARFLSAKNEYDVKIFGFSGPGRVSWLCDQYGIPWKIVQNPISISGLIGKFRLRSFAMELKKEKPDVLLPFTTIPNVACGLVWRATGAEKCVWNQRDLGIERIDKKLERKAVVQIPVFVSNSQAGKDYLVNNLNVAPRKVKVIHNGITYAPIIHDRARWREKLDVGDNTFVACMVANLSQHKDHITLLKAWRIVVSYFGHMNMHPVLLLAGRFDQMAASLQTIAFDLNITSSIQFLGQVKDIDGLLRAVDLGVFSSHSEGCPNGVLECMAAGLAVVGTDIPGIRETLGKDSYTCLTPKNDSDAMAEKIIELALNPTLRTEIGFRNRKRAIVEFSLERMLAETTNLLFEKK